MLEQVIQVLTDRPNIEADELAKLAIGIDLQDLGFLNEARRFRRGLAAAVKDGAIACDHVRDTDSLKVTYRMPTDPAPDESVPANASAPVPARRTTPRPAQRQDEPRDASKISWGAAALAKVPRETSSDAPISTVAQLERVVDKERSGSRSKQECNSIRAALHKRLDLLRAAEAKPVADFMLKIEVVSQIAEIMSDDIKQVLNEVCDDLGRLGELVGRCG